MVPTTLNPSSLAACLTFLSLEALAKVLFCHSRGSNRESSFFKKQRFLDTRFHGYDGTGYFKGTFARASLDKKIEDFSSSLI